MPVNSLISISAAAAAIAAALCSGIPAATGEPRAPMESTARYLPIESVSYEFGSKRMSGYFVQKAGACFVTLMIIEKSDPDELPSTSPTRVRLVLFPGQVAGLDSEEGGSLNVTCGEKASVLLVDSGDRESLVALQAAALPDALASAR